MYVFIDLLPVTAGRASHLETKVLLKTFVDKGLLCTTINYAAALILVLVKTLSFELKVFLNFGAGYFSISRKLYKKKLESALSVTRDQMCHPGR
jgi:hypothetical protein